MDGDLLVTLRLDAGAQARFEALRRKHFPAGRNVVPAHVMLFHALPATTAVTDAVAAAARRPPFELLVSRVRSLGRGVAYDLQSPELCSVHATLVGTLGPCLTPQDRQRYAPHVTVQNKVPPDLARATLADLASVFTPWWCSGVGLDVWTYCGGPWEPLAYEAFPPS